MKRFGIIFQIVCLIIPTLCSATVYEYVAYPESNISTILYDKSEKQFHYSFDLEDGFFSIVLDTNAGSMEVKGHSESPHNEDNGPLNPTGIDFDLLATGFMVFDTNFDPKTGAFNSGGFPLGGYVSYLGTPKLNLVAHGHGGLEIGAGPLLDSYFIAEDDEFIYEFSSFGPLKFSEVPEPASLALLASAFLSLCALKVSRNRSSSVR